MRPAWLVIAQFGVASVASAGDLDTVRARLEALHTAAGADLSDPAVQAGVASVCAQAASLDATLRADGSWADLDYGAAPAGPWPVGTHYARLRTLAQAFRMPSCTGLAGSATLKQHLEAALTWSGRWYCATCAHPGNWWWWNIGVPMSLGPTLLLLQRDLDPVVFAAALDALDSGVSSQYELSGANLTDHALNALVLAVLKNDATRATASTREVESTCVVTATGLPHVEDDGIKADFSFHQHQGALYIGGYGAVFASGVARYVDLTDGTAFAVKSEPLEVFSRFLLDGVVWTLDGEDFDHNVIGRGHSRRGNHAGGALEALLRAALRPGPRQAEVLAAAKAMVSRWRYGFGFELAPLAERVKAAAGDAGTPLGHRHFFASDFTMHRGPGWVASVKMLSSRLLSGENTNTEGKRGSRLSDGRLYLVQEGDEYLGDVYPAMDWRRLPGITVELTPEAASAKYGAGVKAFVGGTGDGRGGVSAMDFAPVAASDSKLTAKKSWFFFDDAVVFLVSDVASGSGFPVETVVEQWPLSDAGAPLWMDGVEQPTDAGWATSRSASWMVFDGVGVWFPGGARANVSREVRAGKWSDLGLGDEGVVSAPILTVWLEHDAGVSAAYALVPRVDAGAMAAWAQAAPLTVLANTPELAAVRDERTGALGAVFWRRGAVGSFALDAPGVLWSTDDGGTLTVSVAEPPQLRPTLHLTVGERLALDDDGDAGVRLWLDGGATRLELPMALGATVTARLHRVAEPEPAAEPTKGCGCEWAPGGLGWVALAVMSAWALRRRSRPAV